MLIEAAFLYCSSRKEELITAGDQQRWIKSSPFVVFVLLLMIFAGRLVSVAGAQRHTQLDTTELQRNLAQAESLYKQGYAPDAEKILRNVIEHAPENFTANEMLGIVLMAESHDSEATVFLTKAAHLNPKLVAAHENLAANYEKLNRLAEAEKELRASVALAPRSFDSQHKLGEFYASKGNFTAALIALGAAQAIKPSDYNNGYDLALAELETGQFSNTEIQVKKLLEQQDIPELHSLLAETYEKQRNFLAAASEYQRAVQMDPKEDAIYDWSAELLRHQNFKQSAETFADGTRRYPQSVRMFTGLGMTESLLGHSDAAITDMLHAIDLEPSNAKSYLLLSMLDDVPFSKAAEVNTRFAQYAEANPGIALAQLYYAKSLLKRDPLATPESATSKQVESLLLHAVQLDPTLADAHLQLGIIDSQRDDYKSASLEFEAVLKYKPALAVAHYRYSQVLVRLGQKYRARQELDEFRRLKTAQLIPDSVQTFLLSDPAEQ